MGLIILVTSFDTIGIYQTFLGEIAAKKTAYNGFKSNMLENLLETNFGSFYSIDCIKSSISFSYIFFILSN